MLYRGRLQPVSSSSVAAAAAMTSSDEDKSWQATERLSSAAATGLFFFTSNDQSFRFLTEYSWAIENEAPLVNKGHKQICRKVAFHVSEAEMKWKLLK